MTREEQIALDKTGLSLVPDGDCYQIATPWKTDFPMLPNNYEMDNIRQISLEEFGSWSWS